MTTCPKCGGANAYKCVAQNVCLDCMITWTDWQQERIQFLESLLREIEEHPHITSDPKRSVPCSFAHREGHRCAAAIAARWREK